MTTAERKRLFCCIGVTCLLTAAAVGAAAITRFFGSPTLCLFRALTGLNCPGCGNTRALIALAHLRFAESLSYNYAYPAELFYLLHVYFVSAKNYVRRGKASYRPRYPAAEYTFLALLLAWGVVRNVIGL